MVDFAWLFTDYQICHFFCFTVTSTEGLQQHVHAAALELPIT